MHSEQGGRDFQELVAGEVLHTCVERYFYRGSDTNGDALGCGTHVVERLCFADVDGEVTRALADADAVQERGFHRASRLGETPAP